MVLTILEPASHRRLTTIEAVRASLKLSPGEPDGNLADLIDRASAAIWGACNALWPLERVREISPCLRTRYQLYPARWPIVSVASIREGQSAVPADGWIVDAEAEAIYRLGPDGFPVCWSAEPVSIEYRAGYGLPGDTDRTLPADVEAVAIGLVREEWFSSGRDPTIRSETVPDVSAIAYQAMRDRLSSRLGDVLARFHRPVVA